MRIFICFDIDHLPLERSLQLVTRQRREQALAYKPLGSRLRCVGAFLLLCHALRHGYGISNMPQLGYEPNGKPFLLGHPNVCFNLSHCKEAVACAVDDRPVGVDVESVRRYRDDLARYVCSDDEMALIDASDNKAKTFIRLWTMKEATLKLTGEGIRSDLHHAIRPDVCYFTDMAANGDCLLTVASWQPVGNVTVEMVSAEMLMELAESM